MKIKLWLILLIVLTCGVSCASKPVELPDWSLAERESVDVSDPVDLPTLCAMPTTVDGTWSKECWAALNAFDGVATENTGLAQDNANALRKSDASYDALIQAGRLQQQLAIIRQQLLDQERRAHTMDNWFYRAVIVLGLMGVAL